jgi:Protein of unknown function (DUF1573)
MRASILYMVASASLPFWLFVAVNAKAQLSSGVRPNYPKVAYSETEFDFGKIAVGQVVEHTFYVTNLSDKPLRIGNVRTGGPGPYIKGEWDKVVEPGKAGRIPVGFRMPGANGTVMRAVTVSFEDASNSPQFLLIRATRWGPIDLEPMALSFGFVEGEPGEETKSLRIFNRTTKALRLEAPACTNDSCRATLRTIQPGQEFELSVTCSNASPMGPSLNGGRVESYVTIKTSEPAMPQLLIYVSSSTVPVFVYPKLAKLHRVELGEDFYTSGFSIRSQGKGPWKISEVTVNAEAESVKAREEAASLWSVSAVFPSTLPSDKDLVFTVKTTHPAMPVIKVPIER